MAMFNPFQHMTVLNRKWTRTFCALALVAMLGAGCQSNNMVANLPPPNFNGPSIAPQQPTRATSYKPTYTAPKGTNPIGPRDWAPKVAARPWRYIVIHHSASPSGSAAVFDKMHRQKGWDELGYHFVIGNGTDSGNGQVEIGSRWPKQKHGAHAKTPDNRYNDYGIGICLVGDFDKDRPTPQQIAALTRLTAYLMRTYHITSINVIGHKDTKATACPGRNLSVVQIRQAASAQAVAGGRDAATAQTAAAELLTDSGR